MLKNYKKKIKAPWVVEVIAERFDNALELMTVNSIVYGGAVRDALAGAILEGDLDICATPADADMMNKLFTSNTRWHPEKDLSKLNTRGKGFAPEQPEASTVGFKITNKSINAQVRDVNLLPSGGLVIKMSDGAIYEVPADHIEFDRHGKMIVDADSLKSVVVPDAPVEVPNGNPYKLKRNNSGGRVNSKHVGEAYKYAGRWDMASSKEPYSKNLPGRVRSYNNADGQKLQIVTFQNKNQQKRGRAVSKLTAKHFTESILTTVRACDIICCAVYMDTDGNVFEALPNAYEDCRNKVLNINKSVITSSLDIGALTERVKKLEGRGWKSNIDLKAIKDKVGYLLDAEEKKSKAKAKHLKERQEKRGKSVEGEMYINWGDSSGNGLQFFTNTEGSLVGLKPKKKKKKYMPPSPGGMSIRQSKLIRRGEGSWQSVRRQYSKSEVEARWLSLTDADMDIKRSALENLNQEAQVNCKALPGGIFQVDIVRVHRTVSDNRIKSTLSPSVAYRKANVVKNKKKTRVITTKSSFDANKMVWHGQHKMVSDDNLVELAEDDSPQYATDDVPEAAIDDDWPAPPIEAYATNPTNEVTDGPKDVLQYYTEKAQDREDQMDVAKKVIHDYAEKVRGYEEHDEMQIEVHHTPTQANKGINMIVSKKSIIREYGGQRDFVKIAATVCKDKYGGNPPVSTLGYGKGYDGIPDNVLVTVRQLPEGVGHTDLANFLRVTLK